MVHSRMNHVGLSRKRERIVSRLVGVPIVPPSKVRKIFGAVVGFNRVGHSPRAVLRQMVVMAAATATDIANNVAMQVAQTAADAAGIHGGRFNCRRMFLQDSLAW